MTGQAEIAAIHGDESVAFLQRLDVVEGYNNGSLVCSICGTALVDAGLGAARGIADGEVVFVCAKLDCLDDFHAH